MIANMILGIIVKKKQYSVEKYASVFMITLGIMICTFYTGKTKKVMNFIHYLIAIPCLCKNCILDMY